MARSSRFGLHPADQLGPWPPDGLESVEACPVCGSTDRETLHEDLEDWTFNCAPGRWTMARCGTCGSGYLNPRPTRQTISLAYEHYYTHEETDAPGPNSLLQKLRAGLGNDYRNARFGANLQPALTGGRWLARMFPRFAVGMDGAYRYLPRPPRPGTVRLLDIGCGSGKWLKLARNAGWQVAGSDPDPNAADVARLNDIEVRPFAADWLDQRNSFDVVTSYHSIEHVHEPVATLRTALDLLRPGGQLSIETPNIDAVSHDLYGRYWRGLETPRHLVLFNRKGLADLLTNLGFTEVRLRDRRSPFIGMALQSRRMVVGLDPIGDDVPELGPPPGIVDRIRASLVRDKVEFLTFTARKA